MIIHDFNVVRVPILPPKTEAPLLIDPDAVLSMAVAPQSIEPVAGWHTQVIQVHDGIQHPQFTHGGPLDVLWQFAGVLTPVDLLSL